MLSEGFKSEVVRESEKCHYRSKIEKANTQYLKGSWAQLHKETPLVSSSHMFFPKRSH